MKRFCAFALLCALLAASPARADGGFVFILGARGNPYWNAMADGIRDEARTKGIVPIIYQTDSDRDAEGELNLCQTAIQLKPAIIVMQAINPNVGIECFKQAAAAGIKIADVDAHLTMADAAKAGLRLSFSVGSDNYRIGQDAAKFTVRSAGKQDPKILILEGSAGSMTSDKQVGGFRDGLQKALPHAQVVASISGEWDRLKAMNIAADILQRTPDLDITYAANDMMGLGAAEAARNANRDIKIISVDGTADARKAVLDGKLTATVAQLPYLMGLKAVDRAAETAKGAKTSLVEVTPTPVLTKELLQAGNDPVLKYLR